MAYDYYLYVGTYTLPAPYLATNNGEGIYIFKFDSGTGQIERIGEIANIDNPSYLAITHDGKYLFANSEVWDWREGTLTAYAINKENGALTYLNQQATQGNSNAHVSVDHTDKYVMVAHYGDGHSVAMFPINEDGSLSSISGWHEHTEKPEGAIVPERQDKSHTHCIVPDPTNTYALVCDLGLDKVMIYKMDLANGKLIPNQPAFSKLNSGSGPRHLIFHPNQKFAYVIHELNATISVLSFDSHSGKLEILQVVSTLPDDFEGNNSCSDIHITPDGKFLYAGNRGHDTLAMYAVDEDKGHLTPIGHQSTRGKTPRNFMIDPTGTFVLVGNQDSDTIVVFNINQKTGVLEETDIIVDCPTPVCLKMLKISASQ